jgi:phage shock protein PspC (stress-responsive transcriptional regulator)
VNQQTTNPRRILRSRSDRIVAGVASGFGRYFGVDPVLIRFGLVLLTFIGGIGAFVYLVAWLVIPDEPVTDPSKRPSRGSRAVLWLMGLALVGLVLSGGIGRIGLGLRADLFWPLVLIIGGVAILWRRAKPEDPELGDHRPAATTASETTDVLPASPDAATVEAPAFVTPDVPGKPSPLHRAVPAFLRLLAAVFGAAAALAITAAVVIALEGPGDLVITALEVVVVAIVLVAAAIWAGRRWRRIPDLLFVATAVIVVLSFAAWLRPPLHGGYGTRDIRPTTVASVEKTYELAGGRLRIDLTDAPLSSRPRAVDASVSLGSLVIVVPDDATVALDAHVGAGELCAFDLRDQGTDISRRTTTPRESAGVLRVRARLGIGRMVVVRSSDQSIMDCRDTGRTFVPTPTSPPVPTAPPTPTSPPVPTLGAPGTEMHDEHHNARELA